MGKSWPRSLSENKPERRLLHAYDDFNIINYSQQKKENETTERSTRRKE
jgi:hypothetical protein